MAGKSLKDRIAEEYLRCSQDILYFIKKHCMIQHPQKGKINFQLFPFQEQCIAEFEHNRYVIINKGRQLGLSTLSAAYVLHKMLFNSDFNCLIIATKQEVAKNLVTKIRLMHDLLPSYLRGVKEEDNKLSLRFANGSQVKAVASSMDAGRSEALSLLIIDECAHIEPKLLEEIWTSAQSTLATGGGAILLSSPFGVGSLFHKIWVSAEEGGEFFPIKLPWYLHPERDQTWRDKQDELLGEKKAAQENDCEFTTSGNSVLEGTLIEWYKQTYQSEPVEKRGFDASYWIWEYPDFTKEYIVTVDVSRGDGSDYSAILVLESESMRQVAEWKGQLGTTELGHMAVNIATEWNTALLAIDNNGVGWAVVQIAIDRAYSNLFYHYKDDTYIDTKHINKGYDLQDKDNMIPGVSISTKTRPVMISKFEVSFRHQLPVCKSVRSLSEFSTFIWNNGKAEARYGYNDDLTMCWAIALWLRDTALMLRQKGIELSKANLENFSRTLYVPEKIKPRNTTQLLKNGEVDDLKWLF